MFFLYPWLVLVLLSTYPEVKSVIRKIIHILMFAFYWFIVEFIQLKLRIIKHEHGWSLLYSIPFDILAY